MGGGGSASHLPTALATIKGAGSPSYMYWLRFIERNLNLGQNTRFNETMENVGETRRT